MRMSTSQITNSGVREMLQRQAEIQHTQLQLSTQKRILKPSDDPVAASAISSISAEISQLEQFNKNADAAKANNELEEGVLSSVNDSLFRIRELMVSLGNGTYGEQEFDSIGVELKEGLKQILGLSNTQNANGNYLFSGGQVKVQSFSQDAAGNISYNGDQSQRMLRVSSGVVEPVSDSGFDVFQNIKNGNGNFSVASDSANTGGAIISSGSYQAPPNFVAEPYSITFADDGFGNTSYTVTGDTSGTTVVAATPYVEGADINFNGITVAVSGTPDQLRPDVLNIAPSQSESVFSVIQSAIAGIENFTESESGRAAFINILTTAQESLDRNMINIDLSRGKIGSRLNVIESEVDTNLSLLISNKTSLSDIEDLDIVEASTRFSQQLVVLEAAQASFVRVQGLSLFNFIR
jgi:flagellar hook-associated protein 3 FlgL